MKWITTHDIQEWAGTNQCQAILPVLTRKLVWATTNSIDDIEFPGGENISLSGWDGILNLKTKTEYLPEGKSVWEFSAKSNPKGKAEKDYKKRTKNPDGQIPSDSTFIFVTSRRWAQKNKWISTKKKEGVWKDVKVIDAQTFEEWLEKAPSVATWLAIDILGKYPNSKMQSAEDYWKGWSTGPGGLKLNSEILLGGRNEEVEKLQNAIATPCIIPVKGTSIEEAIAFVISCHKDNRAKGENFLSRCLIVKDEERFQELSIHKKPLIFILWFENTDLINKAVENGHTVIVPLGLDALANWENTITLPIIERNSFVQALGKIGIKKSIAEKYSKESARNITILRRHLGFTKNVPRWVKDTNIRDIIPALLVGRWDNEIEGDRKIIAMLAGESYDAYTQKLNRLRFLPDSPLIKIESKWRLVSHWDTWIHVGKHVTKEDFEHLRSSFLEVLGEINPAFELEPNQRFASAIYGKNRQYSSWMREGIIQSLILISVFGNKLNIDLENSNQWVDGTVAELLRNDNPLLWKSLEDKLPLISEASPAAFLWSVEKHLSDSKTLISALFESDPGGIFAKHYHNGLLWALEGLAWLPEYLSRSSIILAKLTTHDSIPENYTNKPFNSLVGIFKPWHYQTFASFDERVAVLKLLCRQEKEIAWKLLEDMLPSYSKGVAFPTHKMRWRTFDLDFDMTRTMDELRNTYVTALEMLLNIFDYSEKKLSELVKLSETLPSEDRDKILHFIEAHAGKINQVEFLAWHGIREILAHELSYPRRSRSLQDSELSRYQKLYALFEPKSKIDKYMWLFGEHHPIFPEPRKMRSHLEDYKLLHKKRSEAVDEIFEEYGLEKIKELCDTVKQPWALGEAYAEIGNADNSSLWGLLNEAGNKERFISGFIWRSVANNGFEWAKQLYSNLKQRGFSSEALARIFVSLQQSKSLWDFIGNTSPETEKAYWLHAMPHFYSLTTEDKVFGLEQLMKFERYISALDVSAHMAEELPSSLIADILDRAATRKSNEDVRCDQYRITTLFETLEKRNDLDSQTRGKLEFMYLEILLDDRSKRKPLFIHKVLSQDPNFFIDILKWQYKSATNETTEVEESNLTPEQRSKRALIAYRLFSQWSFIPGTDENDRTKIDYAVLREWIEKVRKFAGECGRLAGADSKIGELLARYPEKNEIWPSEEICTIIESINTQEIKTGFHIGTFNKGGGMRLRRADDAGLAERFYRLAKNHKNSFPIIASELESIAKSYENGAKRDGSMMELEGIEY